MRKILILLFTMSSGILSAQIYIKPNNTYGVIHNRIKPDTVLHLPVFDTTLLRTTDTSAQIRVLPSDGLLYYRYGGRWRNVAGGSIPTWQQTLIAGSQMTQNNFVDLNGFEFGFDDDIKIGGATIGRGANSHPSNTLFGTNSGLNMTTGGNNNTFMGFEAGKNTTFGADNLIIGYQAGLNNTSGAANTFVGKSAGQSITTQNGNTFVGWNAAANNTGDDNTAIGENALSGVSGSSNVAIGGSALTSIGSGSRNVAVGIGAGRNNNNGVGNISIGAEACTNIVGNYNIGIGDNAYSTGSIANNNILIGNDRLGHAIIPSPISNKFLLGNYQSFLLYGDISTGQLKIGNGNALNLESSAIFEIASTSKGVLFPRMTESQRQAIAAPATSLVVYQTDNTIGYYYYDGSNWNRFSTGFGSGTVTSVGLSMPSGFSVSNSPVTEVGTFNVTTTLNGYVKGNGSGFTAAATIPATDLTGTIDNTRLSTNVGYTISHAIGAGVSTAANTTEFIINGPTNASSTEGIRQVPIAIGGTIRAFYIYTSTAQPASGTYVLTIRKNNSSTSTEITLAASAAAGVYSNATTTTVAAGDLLSIGLVNNATAASATIRGFSIFISTN